MLYLVVFFSNVCDIYVCYMLNKITYLLTYLTFFVVIDCRSVSNHAHTDQYAAATSKYNLPSIIYNP